MDMIIVPRMHVNALASSGYVYKRSNRFLKLKTRDAEKNSST